MSARGVRGCRRFGVETVAGEDAGQPGMDVCGNRRVGQDGGGVGRLTLRECERLMGRPAAGSTCLGATTLHWADGLPSAGENIFAANFCDVLFCRNFPSFNIFRIIVY